MLCIDPSSVSTTVQATRCCRRSNGEGGSRNKFPNASTAARFPRPINNSLFLKGDDSLTIVAPPHFPFQRDDDTAVATGRKNPYDTRHVGAFPLSPIGATRTAERLLPTSTRLIPWMLQNNVIRIGTVIAAERSWPLLLLMVMMVMAGPIRSERSARTAGPVR